MFQKQSPSGVFVERCLSRCKKYKRIRVSIFRILLYKVRIMDSVLILENMGQRKPVV